MPHLKANVLVLAAFNAAIAEAAAMPDGDAKKEAQKRLAYGSIRRSKVESVRDCLSVQTMIMHLNKALGAVPIGPDRLAYRFELPHNYRAFTPTATVEVLFRKGPLFAKDINIVELRDQATGKTVYRLHSPNTRPIPTNVVTFIMEGGKLIEWFAGEFDFPPKPSSLGGDVSTMLMNLGHQKVALGVNLVDEAKLQQYRQKAKPANRVHDAAQPTTQQHTAKPTVPSAQPQRRPFHQPRPLAGIAGALAAAEEAAGHKVLEPAAVEAPLAPSAEELRQETLAVGAAELVTAAELESQLQAAQ